MALDSDTLELIHVVALRPEIIITSAGVDGDPGTASLRTLGTGANQAAAGNDSRIVNAIKTNVAGELAGLTEKLSPTSTDILIIEDSSDSNNKKKIQIANLPSGGGGGSDTDAIHDNVASEISAITEKVTPVAGDLLIIEDSADSNNKKRLQIGNLPGDADAIHDNVAGEIVVIAEKITPAAADLLIIEDSADSNNKKRLQIGNLPGGNDPDAIHDNVASEISAITEKVTPVAGDLIIIEDSAAANVKKRVQIGNLPDDPTAIHTDEANEISGVTEKSTPVGADIILIEDSEAGNVKKRVQIDNLPSGTSGGISPEATPDGWGQTAIRTLAYYLDLPYGAPYHEDWINQGLLGTAPGSGWTSSGGTSSYIGSSPSGILQFTGPGGPANAGVTFNNKFDGSTANKWGVAFRFRFTASSVSGFAVKTIGPFESAWSALASFGAISASNGGSDTLWSYNIGAGTVVTAIPIDTDWHDLFIYSDGTNKYILFDGTQIASTASSTGSGAGPYGAGCYNNLSSGPAIQFDDIAILIENNDADLSWSPAGSAKFVVSPSQITANQNDYNPTNWSPARVVRLDSDASRNITGASASSTETIKKLINVGSNDIVIKHQDAGSVAANRFLNSTGADITLGADETIEIFYDGVTERWRVG